MENAKVLLDPDFRFRRIAYAMKVGEILNFVDSTLFLAIRILNMYPFQVARNDIASVGEARQRLHDVVYQHLTVKIIEEM